MILFIIAILFLTSYFCVKKSFAYPFKLLEEHRIHCQEYLKSEPKTFSQIKSRKTIVVYSIILTVINLSYLNIYQSLGTALFYCIFATLCFSLLLTDLKHNLLPECITVILILSGLVFSLTDFYPTSLHDAISGGVIGVCFALVVSAPFILVKKIMPLAIGDLYFIAGVGIWIGQSKLFQFGLMSVAIAILTGLILKNKAIPLGIALGIAGIISTLIPNIININ
ncbi:prepilin peptidase [Citrobacter freundii]|uniref:prepilin peptidase n=1 Tax=Citrobacter freundii TaxID=546 RepID=UPI0019058052|nr:prepilin peptidase [Citrobacter freundii]MBJ8931619.1 prepilin peptidase [Citrobacter freundii]